jgi:hypothetical protein
MLRFALQSQVTVSSVERRIALSDQMYWEILVVAQTLPFPVKIKFKAI